MEYKDLTENQKIPVLGLGTWGIGSGTGADYSQDEKHVDAIIYAFHKGITHIDTAEIYSAGRSEELVGEAIKKFDREKLLITTKVSPQHLEHDQILSSAENSLKRLKTDYIDLYLIHWPNLAADMKKVMAAFDKLIKEKLIRFVGVSNFSVDQFRQAQQHTSNKIVTNQVHYNLLHREPEQELLDFCQEEKVILTAYSPLAEGKLVGGKFPVLDKVATKYGKTPVQVALRWLIEKPQVIAIPKSSSRDHIDEILRTLVRNLEKEDEELLDKSF